MNIGVIVEPQGLSGGLADFWKRGYDVSLLHSDSRVIDLKVKLGSMTFFVSWSMEIRSLLYVTY